MNLNKPVVSNVHQTLQPNLKVLLQEMNAQTGAELERVKWHFVTETQIAFSSRKLMVIPANVRLVMLAMEAMAIVLIIAWTIVEMRAFVSR